MTTRRGSRRWPWLVLGGAGLASLALGVVGAAAQDGGGVVNGLDAVAASDGIGSTFGAPDAQPYPVAASQIAHTEATLSTGPSGYALASTAWPGPLAANAGSLAVLLGAPKEAGEANYRGRAEAFSAGPNDAELAGMHAHAEGGVAEATAGAQDLEGTPGATTGDVATRSFSSFEAGIVRSVSSCTASDIGFAEGAVAIGSVRTEAEATTNGTDGMAGGRTLVSGVKVAGQDATVDEDGVRFTDPATAPIGEQVLVHFGIEMFVASPRTTEEPAAASHRAGSLVIIWEPPDSGGYIFIYSICGSNAAVALRTGLAFQPFPQLPPSAAPPTFAPDTGGFSAPVLPPTATAPVVPTTPVPEVVATEQFEPEPISFERYLSIWPYIIGLFSVIAAGIGLRRAHDAALVPRAAAVTCPLEGVRS